MEQEVVYTPGEVLVFVYGSLKRNCYNHFSGWMGPMIAEGKTEEKFAMYDGPYPRVAAEPKLYPIQGELYRPEKSYFERIDNMERRAGYEAISVKVKDKAGNIHEAQMYLSIIPLVNREPMKKGLWPETSKVHRRI